MYSQEMADTICEQIADGKSLRAICLAEDMPDKSTVFRWLAADEGFRDQYARAREAQADALFDDILDIADDGSRDSYIDEDGNERTNQDVIARSRLRVDARKWMAGKLRPKVYGDKLELGGTVKHDHTLGLSGETSDLLASLQAGPSGAGDAAPVPD